MDEELDVMSNSGTRSSALNLILLFRETFPNSYLIQFSTMLCCCRWKHWLWLSL